MATTLLLIRHGRTQSNIDNVYSGRTDEEMNAEGYIQLDKLSHRLKNMPITEIYSSPLRRTYTTAKQVAKELSISCKILEELTEIDLGIWQGLSREKVKRAWPQLWDQQLVDPGKIALPNGETFQQTMDRAIGAFENIAKTNINKCAAIVTHEIIIKMLVIYVLKAPTSIYHHFQIDCASITEVRIVNDKSKLIGLNSTS